MGLCRSEKGGIVLRVSIPLLRRWLSERTTHFLTIVGKSGYCAMTTASLSSRATGTKSSGVITIHGLSDDLRPDTDGRLDHQKDAGRAPRKANAWLVWITADQQQNGVTRPEKEGVLFMSGYKNLPCKVMAADFLALNAKSKYFKTRCVSSESHCVSRAPEIRYGSSLLRFSTVGRSWP